MARIVDEQGRRILWSSNMYSPNHVGSGCKEERHLVVAQGSTEHINSDAEKVGYDEVHIQFFC